MTVNSAIEKIHLLKLLKNLLEVTTHVEVETWCKEHKLTSAEFEEVLNLFGSLRLNFELFKKGEKTYLRPPGPDSLVNISFSEWLGLELGTQAKSGYKVSLYDQLESDADESGPSLLDGYTEATEASEPTISEREEIIKTTEEAIHNKHTIKLSYGDKDEELNPRKIIYLDGDISIVGENIKDGHLQNVHLTQIESIEVEAMAYECIYTLLEVDEFINSIRSMNENAVRLVLKIYSRDNFSLNFNHMYFDNPCLFSNSNGDFIWAATLEPSQEVYEWLCELGPAVEILDPSDFKRDFISYCENKLKKLA